MQNQFGFSTELDVTPQRALYKVLLIGDSCVDRYVYGKCSRLSPEAPVPVLEYSRTYQTMGMAWNVRQNLLSFGIEVYMLTNKEHPIKTRYVDERSNQQIMRFDENDSVEEFNYDLPDQSQYDALIISDYNKGFLTQEKLFELASWFNGPVFIDSKKTILPQNCFLKLNNFEANRLEGDYPLLITTKGSAGSIYKGKTYPGINVPVFDVAGAGDTFLSALVYFYLKLGMIEYAIPYANKAAAIAVQNPGTYVLTGDDVNDLCC